MLNHSPENFRFKIYLKGETQLIPGLHCLRENSLRIFPKNFLLSFAISNVFLTLSTGTNW